MKQKLFYALLYFKNLDDNALSSECKRVITSSITANNVTGVQISKQNLKFSCYCSRISFKILLSMVKYNKLLYLMILNF